MLGRCEASAPVLVVDDDRAVAGLLALFLQRLGLVVTVAHSHDEAAERLADGGWSLLVTDLQLTDAHGREGYALLAQSRRESPHTRTILVSGSADPTVAHEAREHGADLFLPKPISFAELSSSVRSLLDLV